MPWSIIFVGAAFVGFSGLAVLFPCNPGQRRFLPRGLADDVLYYLMAALLYGGLTWAIVSLLVRASAGEGAGAALQSVKAGWGPAGRLPLLVQVLAVMLIADICQYWLHRAFHGRALWPFHAIHHGPREVNWSTTFRVHPVNYVLYSTSVAVLVQLAGFRPEAFAVVAPINFFSGALVHANLNWTFGPLRFVLASPVFHRWHHSMDPAARDRNFAPTFAFLDLMFGTFHMPKGELPRVFGAEGVPEHFLGQLAWPFIEIAGRIRRSAKPSPGALPTRP